MDDLERRLIQCFAIVFPDVPDHEIRQADATSFRGWDSLATVTLINVVEEEFQFQIDVEEIGEFLSFPRFLEYLRSR